MKKKLSILVCLGLIIIGSVLYVSIKKKDIEQKMWHYLAQENYSEEDIHSLKIRHSFMNIILSYNEWTVEVVYKDELTSQYIYTIKNDEIVESGVSGTTNKEDLKH